MRRQKIFFLVLLFLFSLSSVYAESVKCKLHTGWKFQRVSKDVLMWYPATVPGCVQTDLLAIGDIEDPYFRMNERNIQWIDKEDWRYKLTFDVPSEIYSKNNIFIRFDGLDIFADVVLNGQNIISADNMFRVWKADIKNILKEKGNVLEVYFHSPTRRGLELTENSPYWFDAANDLSHIGGLFDKKISMYMRKAPYHFGWDWGPRILTIGIWKDVTLEGWNDARVEYTHYITESIERKSASVKVETDILADKFIPSAELVIENNGTVIARKSISLNPGVNRDFISFDIKNPKLWWCNGMGEQNMYDFTSKILADGKILASQTDKIGLRTIRLEQEKDQWGRSFRFVLNGVPVYAKGVNVIPFDNILTNVNSDTYKSNLEPAAQANMNMLRVWGGGIYETDEFYRQCDSLGLMIWQDFIFSCTMYPSEGKLLETMKGEFADNIRRIRNHPSLALWCGSNELEYSWASKKLRKRNTQENVDKIWQMYLDQNQAIQEALDTLCPEICYQPSSPFRGYGKNKSPYEGDYHSWSVLSGSKPITYFEEGFSRFYSEYGYESFDYYESLVRYAPGEEDQRIYSDVMLWHQRQGYNAVRANNNIIRYISDNYPAPKTFKDTLYASHVLQADAVKLAIEAHRRNKGFCWGSLYWQLGNCWPVSSDSSIDYDGNWKGLHYFVKKAFEDRLVSGYIHNDTLDVYIITDRLKAERGTLEVEVFGFDGTSYSRKTTKVAVPSNSSRMVYQTKLDDILSGADPAQSYVRFTFTDIDGVKHRNMRFFRNQKDLDFLQPDIKIDVVDRGDFKEVKMFSNVFTRAVYLSVSDSDLLHFSDNFFDLYPSEPYSVSVRTDISASELERRLRVNTINSFVF